MSKLHRFLGILCISLIVSYAHGGTVAQDPKIKALIKELVTDHDYEQETLDHIFSKVELQPRVIELITRPAESLPWQRYRKIFISEYRMDKGVEFWKENKSILRRAEKKYGVPASVIVAIIGVETSYGSNLGGFAVIEALSTLALQYPRRSEFFTAELKKFLLLVRDENLDPFKIKGSYAGAIGIPQFMPSSYGAYAVDFSADGKRDLVLDVQDAIGSVANYLYRHKWAKGGPIVDNVNYSGAPLTQFQTRNYKPVAALADIRKTGASVDGGHAGNTKASLINLAADSEDPEYRAAFRNFYVITKYNRSLWYAMAVYELSEGIADRFYSE